mmetsp:Transcript_33296/g.72644  ORF Transcript_33296/g.72644 Transcript_33296/m.72644 type:complete len:257 (-) Transcript_33296:2822-3592(-)
MIMQLMAGLQLPCLSSSRAVDARPGWVSTRAHIRHPRTCDAYNCVSKPALSSAPVWHRTKALGAPSRWRCQRQETVVSAQGPTVRFRKGREQDLPIIQRMVFEEKMNPLQLDPTRFLIAEDNAGVIKGAGQLKSWPCLYRMQDWRGQVVRALNLKPNWEGELFELASLVITPDSRGQGVGSALVQELLATAGPEADICVLTIEPTVPFYERLGFSVLEPEDVPRPLSPELFWGNIVAQIAVGSKVVVMARRSRLAR